MTATAASSRCSVKWRSPSTWRSSITFFDSRKAKAKVKLDTGLSADDLKVIIDDYKKLIQKATGKPFPQDPREQLTLSARRRLRLLVEPQGRYYRKMEKIPDDIGTAANVQAMVFGNLGDTSATGVGFTRDPATGEKLFYGEFLVNAQGGRCRCRYPHAAADL